ncbi:hypothetical protein LTR37_006747 [Vermiconidia calcicola]|uniref:Uncharacterized protein n=1 Tax=Vermiconidia calcicola TaxID=1690605 RepID=A0ACC3NFG4_9PEZI|nr:hypothetical protein LTR37_006747 [Vermiconidia calcicola]
MGRIYQEAQEVLIWLGEPQRAPSVNIEQATAGASHAEPNIADGINFLHLLASGEHFHDLPTSPSKSWRLLLEALRVILDAKWFERTWTIQEVVLAKKASIMIGEYRIEWHVVEQAWIQWSHHYNSCCGECNFALPRADMECIHRFASRIIDLINARRRRELGQTLLQPLLKFKAREATDERDKIYGLLGLQSGSAIVDIKPNYKLALEKVFEDFAIELIRSQGWLGPLHLDLTQILALPSWVPDWTYMSSEPADYTSARFTASATYRASEGFIGDFSFSPRHSLKVTGIEVDYIARLSCPYQLKERPAEQLQVVAGWREFLHLDSLAREQYHAGGTMEEAFCSTVFANRFHESSECRPLQLEDIEQWRSHLIATS